MKRTELEKLTWWDVVKGNIPEDITNWFTMTLWFYGSGEWDQSEAYFNSEKSILLANDNL